MYIIKAGFLNRIFSLVYLTFLPRQTYVIIVTAQDDFSIGRTYIFALVVFFTNEIVPGNFYKGIHTTGAYLLLQVKKK